MLWNRTPIGHVAHAVPLAALALVTAIASASQSLRLRSARSAMPMTRRDTSANRRDAERGAWGALDGTVQDVNGVFLAHVDISALDDATVHARTATTGAFRIDSLAAGLHVLRFRRLGLSPLVVSVEVEPNATTSVDATLGPAAARLTTVNVQGTRDSMPAAVAARMRRGFGQFMTHTDIMAHAPMQMSDALRHATGVAVRGRPGREVMISTRSSCALEVYVDGVQVNGAMNSGSVNLIQPNDVAVVEIYNSSAQIPASLPPASCGAIYMWTR